MLDKVSRNPPYRLYYIISVPLRLCLNCLYKAVDTEPWRLRGFIVKTRLRLALTRFYVYFIHSAPLRLCVKAFKLLPLMRRPFNTVEVDAVFEHVP